MDPKIPGDPECMSPEDIIGNISFSDFKDESL